MGDNEPLRLCENCEYFWIDGYENPDDYCSAGVERYTPHHCMKYVGNGCSYTDEQLKIMREWRNIEHDSSYDSIEEWIEDRGLDD